jgi:glycosyltransferase involved in cell wall biosynthesis
MKKVLVIAPYPYLPYFSGGQKFIACFLEYLGRETDLTVITVPGTDVSQARSYKVLPLLKGSFSRYFDRSLINKITQLIEKEKFDAVTWEHPYYSWLAKRIKKKTGIRTFIHTHNIEYQRFRSLGKIWWPLLRSYEKKCLQDADGVMFITPEDREYAITKWGLSKERTVLVPFGTDIKEHPGDKQQHRDWLCRQHDIDPGEKIFLFNGLLSYIPNTKAVRDIITYTNPQFINTSGFRYKILITGKGLPDHVKESLKSENGKNIIYTGFVEDIVPYFKGADVFLNPVTSGGGVKTKMVEAIAYGTTVVSKRSGAAGMNASVAGEKLKVVEDDNWKEFAQIAIKESNINATTPPGFYSTFFWGNIIENFLSSEIWKTLVKNS